VQRVEVQKELAVEEEIVLPTGSLLITVGGIDIAQNAVGPALQLLEFCCAFSKVYNVMARKCKGLSGVVFFMCLS